MSQKLISIVIPVYNEEGNIFPVYQRVRSVMQGLAPRFDYEFVFTDNHSTDGTFSELRQLAEEDAKVRVLRFSRNFGFQRSILTGYVNARGDVAVQLDCDLQDPPELIPEFLEQWEQGYAVVYGIRRSRKESWVLANLRRVFYATVDTLSEYPLPRNAGDFRLVDRRVLNVLANIDDSQPYLRGTIAALGFRQTGIEYDRSARQVGESKFPISKLLGLATDGILNHSIVPLRIATFTGLFFSTVSFFGMLIYFIGKVYFDADWPAGFTTLTMLILLNLGLHALFLGVIGEYVGRIYKQVKARPTTIVETELNPVKKSEA